ncbi:MAG: hypothetical protein IIC10_04195, partial [Proteobacteria bacterium]|nr:hypothetical protein [Pseudomonadota bacterium]
MKQVAVIFLVLALLSPSYGADEMVSFPEAMMTIPERTNYQRTSTFAEVV